MELDAVRSTVQPAVERAGRIAVVEAIPIALPVRRSWRWRGLEQELGRWVLVRVQTTDGVVGWGEATPLADWGGDHGRYYGETVTTVMHVITDLIAPALIGVGIWDHPEVELRVSRAIRGHPYARAAVDIAMWDVRGRTSGEPIHHLLGGPLRSEVRVAHMLGLMSVEEATEEAKAATADGVSAFQIKLTGDVDADVEQVAAVREIVGPDAHLRADINQGYGTLPINAAIDAVNAIAAHGLDVVEQPVEGLGAMAAVRAATDVAIMADESCWNSADAVELVKAEAADAVSVYVAKAGGLREACRVAEIARAAGLPCDVNGSLESGIGTLASIHVAAACASVSLPSVISCSAPAGAYSTRRVGRYYEDDVLSQALPFEHGCLLVPDGPGLGITVDEDRVRAMAIEVVV
jgi:L-alanine-DL-glutamate epimerase-like enolase superfamily enzyme